MMRRWRRDLGWKAASLVAAFGLWVWLVGTRELTTSISAPVQYRNVPPNLEISSEFVETVHLVLRGPSASLSRIARNPPPLVIDLRPMKGPGERTFSVSRPHFDLPAGVALERAVPAQIRTQLEPRMVRDVPVEVRIGNIPAGMRVKHIESLPPVMTIAGPESRVSRIEKVETDPVDLAALGPDNEIVSNVYSGHAQVTCLTPPAVRVRAVLEPARP
jgi:YbbR domain-containing protein